MEDREKPSMRINRVVTVKTNETFLWGDGTSTLISSNVTEINGEIAEPTTKHLRQVMEVLHEQDTRAKYTVNKNKDSVTSERRLNVFLGVIAGLALAAAADESIAMHSEHDAPTYVLMAGIAIGAPVAGRYGLSRLKVPSEKKLGEAQDFAATIDLRRDLIMQQLVPDAAQANQE